MWVHAMHVTISTFAEQKQTKSENVTVRGTVITRFDVVAQAQNLLYFIYHKQYLMTKIFYQ